jgi:hypothetical protein
MKRNTFLYVLWVLANSTLLFFAGYPQMFVRYVKKLPFVDEPWSKFIEHSDKLFLISAKEIITYDITEYSLALLIPVFVAYLLKVFKPKKMKYQKPKPIW